MFETEINNEIPFTLDINCAITVCDKDGIILFMNEKAKSTFAKYGDLIGKNLFECHNSDSAAKIRHMLASGESNTYTITKGGQHKIIYQTPWRRDGQIAGMIEISMITPINIPHYDRG